MKVETTSIEGLLILTPDVFGDERGYFMESYNAARYKEHGIPEFVQDNESRSQKGVLRGLHYQLPPHGQGKLVRVVEGEVLDVAVDLRPDSPTLGQHVAVTLGGENKKQFWIPSGFAHGFLTLSDTVLFQYKCTAPYHKASERSIRWDDAQLAIEWGTAEPTLAEKDANGISFREAVEEMKQVGE